MGIDGSKFNKLFVLIDQNKTDQIEFELENLKNNQACNLQNKHGVTLLMFAVLNGNVQIVNALVSNQADTSLKDSEGRTALFYLIYSKCSKRSEIAKLLIRNNCPIDSSDVNSNTCLHEAVISNNLEMVKILLEEDADVNLCDDEGVGPLQRAVDSCNFEMVKLILAKKVNVNQADRNGFTALHIASLHNDIEIMKLLINKGANINAKDKQFNTPLTFARQNNSRDAIFYLRKLGAKEFRQKK